MNRRLLSLLVLVGLACGCGGSTSTALGGPVTALDPNLAQPQPQRSREVSLSGPVSGHPGETLNLELEILDGLVGGTGTLVRQGSEPTPLEVEGTIDEQNVAHIDLFPDDLELTESLELSGPLEKGGTVGLVQTGQTRTYGTVTFESVSPLIYEGNQEGGREAYEVHFVTEAPQPNAAHPVLNPSDISQHDWPQLWRPYTATVSVNLFEKKSLRIPKLGAWRVIAETHDPVAGHPFLDYEIGDVLATARYGGQFMLDDPRGKRDDSTIGVILFEPKDNPAFARGEVGASVPIKSNSWLEIGYRTAIPESNRERSVVRGRALPGSRVTLR